MVYELVTAPSKISGEEAFYLYCSERVLRLAFQIGFENETHR